MASTSTTTSAVVLIPRITIEFCTQCRWMLRAAYYAQELLSTFSTTLGEVALVPATGGVFEVRILYDDASARGGGLKERILWDRGLDGGFPETKVLKRLVRDVIDPGRALGHIDGVKATESNEKDEKEEGAGKHEELGQGESNRPEGKPTEEQEGQAHGEESSGREKVKDQVERKEAEKRDETEGNQPVEGELASAVGADLATSEGERVITSCEDCA